MVTNIGDHLVSGSMIFMDVLACEAPFFYRTAQAQEISPMTKGLARRRWLGVTRTV